MNTRTTTQLTIMLLLLRLFELVVDMLSICDSKSTFLQVIATDSNKRRGFVELVRKQFLRRHGDIVLVNPSNFQPFGKLVLAFELAVLAHVVVVAVVVGGSV
jgi:hypothetical protein